MSFNIFDININYNKILKKFDKIKSITSMRSEGNKLICISPFGEGRLIISNQGWLDEGSKKKGGALDLLADLAGMDRQSPEVDGLALEEGILEMQAKKSVYSATELMEMDLPLPTTWLGGYVGAGDATLIVALPGVGKTWFTLSIALALASNRVKIGPWKAREQKRTLIVDFEMGATHLRKRLNDLAKGYSMEVPEQIGVMSPELCLKSGLIFNDLADKEHQKLLFEALADYDLVIIDNINAAYPSGEDDENSPKFWSNPQNLVMAIRQLNKACIMVHHATKGDPKNPAGSGKNTRFFDNVMALVDTTDYTQTDTKRIKFHFKKSRHFPISRENQPELELRDFSGGVHWAETSFAEIKPEIKYEYGLSYVEKDDIPW